MLILSRRKGETIVIGDNIEISVIDVQGDTVKLGIKAPRSLSVHRQEIYDEIQAANREALQNLPTAEQLKKLQGI
jgi:carbon storage regulator